MLWSYSRVKHLKDRAKQSQGQIQNLFIRNVIQLPGNKRAWGQFFNENSGQYGIYGTSAGLQVLLQAGYSSEDDFVRGSSQVLEEAWSDQRNSNRFFKKRDTALIYKLAYLAEACAPSLPVVNESCSPMDELIKRCLPSGGWGEFYYSETDRDGEPKIISTAVVLLALSRYRPFSAKEECEKSLHWLCRRLLESHNRGTYEIALASLALIEYDFMKVKVSEWEDASKYCRKFLLDWLKHRTASLLGIQENHHYISSSDGSRGNKYLFFLPHCLVAINLIKWGPPPNYRRYVLKVISFFTSQVLEKNGFAPDSRRQISTVDHLWIFRLLKEFEAAPIEKLLPQPFYVWSAASRQLRALLMILFLAIGIIAVYIGVMLKNAGSPMWAAAAGVIATVSLGLFGRTVWEFYIKGSNT